jgi:hypothetical protein
MPQRVVILSKYSLFSEGVASRFQQYPERVEIYFIDPQNQDYLERISAIQPSAVILNTSEVDSENRCLLCSLLATFPEIMIIRLAVEQDLVQVITSQQNRMDEIRDLLDLLGDESQ